ncbi:MAG: hypothetical protein ABJA82_13595, partial [Myxococcales bacterium]
GTSGTGGRPGSGGAGTGGSVGTGGTGATIDGGVPDSAGGAASGGSTPAQTGGAGGSAGGPGGPTLASLCPATAGVGGAAGAGGATAMSLAFTNVTYQGDPRVIPSEALFSFINTVDDPHTQIMRLHNSGTTDVHITSLQLVGNTLAPGTNPPATPGAAGGTLFPLNYNEVSLPAAFKITPNKTIPATLAAGADLDVTVQFLSTQTNPPDRMYNIGGQAVSAVLVAKTDAPGCIPAGLYAVSLWNNSETGLDSTTTPPTLPSANWARYEPTFGQVVATLGYKVNLGSDFIQELNTNNMAILGPAYSTEEVQVHTFVKADSSAPVQLLAVGRFAPPTDLPYGWYPVGSLTGMPTGAGGAGGAASGAGGAGVGGAAGAAPPTVTDAQPAAIPSTSTQAATQPAPLRVVATMLSSPLGVDWNTSNYSEQILPPFKTGSNGTTFDPGTMTFGIWTFSNQRTTGGLSSAGVPAPNVGNGDYDYSQDSLNIDAVHSHRVRVYPLKDRAGVLVPHAYLIGWEEASNGDYQDFVFILKNVNPAP